MNDLAGKMGKKKSKKPSSNISRLEKARLAAENLDWAVARQTALQVVESLENASEKAEIELLEQALELTAEMEMEMGLFDHAVEVCSTLHLFGTNGLEHLEKACQVLPDDGYSKYMYLGQLCVGVDAVKRFERGIGIMEKELERMTQETEESMIMRRQISSALCSLTEMYMTDLWYLSPPFSTPFA